MRGYGLTSHRPTRRRWMRLTLSALALGGVLLLADQTEEDGSGSLGTLSTTTVGGVTYTQPLVSWCVPFTPCADA